MEVTLGIPEKGPSNQARGIRENFWRRQCWNWALTDEQEFSEQTTSDCGEKLGGEQDLGEFREFLTRA